ncbi:MAG: type I 3-dehydroquinate dehydratase [Acidobacteriota bacterium]
MPQQPQVVQVVTGRTMAEIRRGRDAAVADLIELRLDGVADLDVAAALSGRHLPVIVTCRASWEGGAFDGSEEERFAVLSRAVALGAEFVDVEWKADRRHFVVSGRTQLVLSHHDFEGTPADLAGRVRAMRAERPDILKIAATPTRLRDLVAIRDAMAFNEPHVAIAMGFLGHISRSCPAAFGSCWTFAGTNAPGQLGADDLRRVYRVASQSSATTIYGVAGQPLGHSASPAMHNAMLGARGLDAVYVPFETADAAELLDVAQAFDVCGLSVTAPLKESAFAAVPSFDDLSREIGALNTLRRSDAGWDGRNFDMAGLLAPLDARGLDLRGRRVVVLGAGGAARMAVRALQSRGALVEIAARRIDRGETVARELGAVAAVWPPLIGWDLLVNTTPAGTSPNVDESPLEREAVQGRMVYDLIYNPEETTLLRWARQAGAETIGGLEMLVGQACLQFEWWTGHRADPQVMTEAARRFIGQAQRHV